jgi:endonuclease/exonuclease/phosphatase family metal-dependent hydrolase
VSAHAAATGGSGAASGGSAAATGTALRVMTYNLHGLRDDRAALVRVVRAAAPDVLVLQEAAGRLRTRGRCGRVARMFGMLWGAGGLDSVGNLVLTTLRVRVHRAGALRYPLTPGRHLRGAAVAHCSAGLTPFTVVATHLSTDPGERPAQARLLRATVDALPGPVLLAGDLNDTPDSEAWRVLAGGRVDAAGTGSPATFPARAPRRRIDAVLVDPSVGVRACRVVDGPDARRASDHLPVVADLLLPGE